MSQHWGRVHNPPTSRTCLSIHLVEGWDVHLIHDRLLSPRWSKAQRGIAPLKAWVMHHGVGKVSAWRNGLSTWIQPEERESESGAV